MTKQNTADVQLTPPQLAALHSYKARHGRTWKAKLLGAWQSGRATFDQDEGMLRTVRNQLGPSGLLKLRL